MDIKRITSGLLGFPLVLIILLIGNKYVVDILLAVVTILAMDEYLKAISKVCKPIKWIAYLSCIIIAIIHIIPKEAIPTITILAVPVILLILFAQVIATNMKTNFKDVAYTFLGIFYITFFIMFLSLIRGLENGIIILGYTIIVAWSTDIFAYLTGKKIGKHHFSQVSPKKTVEGCIGGIIGAVLISLLYVYITNTYLDFNLEVSNIYVFVAIISLVLSIISQIGDFVASSIKRFANMKDYGNLLPGHGGMLDRIDSLIFIAPFVYMIISFI